METKTITSRRVQTKRISYRKMAEMLLQLQVEFNLLANTHPENEKDITATNCITPDSVLFHFEGSEFSLSLDLVRKGGEA